MLGVKILSIRSYSDHCFSAGTAYDLETGFSLVRYAETGRSFQKIVLEFPGGHRRECTVNEARVDLKDFFETSGRSEGVKAD